MKRIRFLKPFIVFPLLTVWMTSALMAAEQPALNDTGVDWCSSYTELRLDCPQKGYPGQDAEFGRDLLAKQGKLEKKGSGHAGFDFTKIDKEGKPLPADAKEWSCVLDNHTGLMWEVKTADGGLQDMNHTYTWYNPDPKTNGGGEGVKDGGKCKGSRCDTEAYVEAINAQALCGRTDWYLPLAEELRSIVDYSRSFPAIDTDYFPNTPSEPDLPTVPFKAYWASESWVMREGGPDAYVLQFHGGKVRFYTKDEANVRVRLVRKAR